VFNRCLYISDAGIDISMDAGNQGCFKTTLVVNHKKNILGKYAPFLINTALYETTFALYSFYQIFGLFMIKISSLHQNKLEYLKFKQFKISVETCSI